MISLPAHMVVDMATARMSKLVNANLGGTLQMSHLHVTQSIVVMLHLNVKIVLKKGMSGNVLSAFLTIILTRQQVLVIDAI